MNNPVTYVAVPADLIEDRQTQGVHDIINRHHQAKELRAEQLHKLRISALEEQDRQCASVLRLGAELACCTAGIAMLVFLAHVGALAGWIMHLGSVALALLMGIGIGRGVR